MHFKNILTFIFLLSLSYLNAQQRKEVLFTVTNQPVSTDEFIKVFNKNRDIVSEENKKSIEEYLELYINYKLKLKQAYELKYDTVSTYKKELLQYKEQLIIPYLTDSEITGNLVKEAYNRTKTEVNASHILIRLQPKAKAADTLLAYQKIIEARNKIVEGASFETIAKQYSEDPSAQKNGGNLGYFSAFSMVYSFENVAYNTKINEVSMPFKTQFGYHIVKVNDFRESKGEVEVAHIMIKENNQDSLYAKTKINELYAKLKQGERFEMLAQRHSEDRNSAINGGKLAKFNATRMIKPFADVAFSMENINDISLPFKTPYGWHIIKLIRKLPIKDFDIMKGELTKKIEKSKRYKLAGTSIVKRLINEYEIIEDDAILKAYFKNDTVHIANNLKTTVFSINGVNTVLNDLVNYKAKYSNKSAKEAYTLFFEMKIIEYFKNNLEKTDSDFAFTLQEYKDGLLLFDLLQDKVWKRAEKDTVGLKDFFDKNQENYYWKKRGDVIIASCTNEGKAAQVKKYFEESKEIEEIKKLVNEGATIHVLFTKGLLEENHKKLPKNFKLNKEGVSEVIDEGPNNFIVVKVLKIIVPQTMLLNEAKGKVINDYQEYLDHQWVEELKQQYSVKVKKRVLKKLIKQNQN
ncbi:MAG: peptidylprolyl isomerase [Flavobacteriaceae bacterium]|nr:peptidylprolyl isomerase [Flavobacteriaceae bacterium]